jgi:hypothetical protein
VHWLKLSGTELSVWASEEAAHPIDRFGWFDVVVRRLLVDSNRNEPGAVLLLNSLPVEERQCSDLGQSDCRLEKELVDSDNENGVTRVRRRRQSVHKECALRPKEGWLRQRQSCTMRRTEIAMQVRATATSHHSLAR